MTTPWPAKAASPWMSTGRTWLREVSRRRICRARTEPSTTGLMISRCDGLNASTMWVGPPSVSMSEE